MLLLQKLQKFGELKLYISLWQFSLHIGHSLSEWKNQKDYFQVHHNTKEANRANTLSRCVQGTSAGSKDSVRRRII
jgi:hypothetical protein